jgi:sigma-B regulation protein RsbU (phosphoserine phosphatase)
MYIPPKLSEIDMELRPSHHQDVLSAGEAGRVRQEAVQLLAETAREFSSSLRLEEVLRNIARRIYRLVDCHLFSVLLFDPDDECLELAYALKYGEPVEAVGRMPLGYGLSGTAAALREVIRVADVCEDPRYIRFHHAEVDIRSELAVPLLCQGRLVGVLDLESLEPGRFTDEHEQMLTALAGQMATSIENARLYETVRAHEQALARDLATARMIQKGLLPRRAPDLPGAAIGHAFAPARELAGDFYDFLPYPDGRVALVVGDVAGKATPAALYGSLAVGLLRGHVVQRNYGPAAMLNHLNDHLSRLRVQDRFLALIYALYDPARRSLRLASAGVPLPRLVRDGRVKSLDVTGLPLGLFPDAVYEELRLKLRPGDLVVFFSDGLEDGLLSRARRSASGNLDELLARVEAGAPALAVAEQLLADSVPRFDAQEPLDDRTVVTLRVAAAGGPA